LQQRELDHERQRKHRDRRRDRMRQALAPRDKRHADHEDDDAPRRRNVARVSKRTVPERQHAHARDGEAEQRKCDAEQADADAQRRRIEADRQRERDARDHRQQVVRLLAADQRKHDEGRHDPRESESQR
jgi:hypothetical protein